jgi:hypothetical protein
MTFACAVQTCEKSGLGEGFIYFVVSFSGNGRCGDVKELGRLTFVALGHSKGFPDIIFF